ncbi:MAG: D-glycero-beta-D-manno-heptose-7-phosphate kinase [Thermodesulfobacteriota bacterium]
MNESLIRSLQPLPILVAGDVMVDEYVMGEVERISPESPVPVVLVRDRSRRLGGAGNVARNLLSLGARVALFASVGKDPVGRWFRKHCNELGIESFWLKEDEVRPTTVKTRVVARNQQLVRIDEENAGQINEELEAAIIKDVESVVPQVKAVVISDYGKGFLTPRLLQAFISASRSSRVPILIDPKGMDFTRYRGATYITPNLRETSQAAGIEITDHATLVQAGRVLLERTEAEGIIITRGREGATLVSRQKVKTFAVKPVEIIDVTGAGDTVIAALALSLANGLSVENAISIANLAASIVVSRFGAASVTRDELINHLAEQKASPKVLTTEEVGTVLRNHRAKGETIVFTNGCFDLLHSGHLKTLREASEMGNVLVVGINSDLSVGRIKGPGRPVMKEADRIELVAALSFVDYVVVFGEDTPKQLIEEVRPDVLVKGEDWRGKKVVGEEVVTSRCGRVAFIKHLEGISTTELIKRIKTE